MAEIDPDSTPTWPETPKAKTASQQFPAVSPLEELTFRASAWSEDEQRWVLAWIDDLMGLSPDGRERVREHAARLREQEEELEW